MNNSWEKPPESLLSPKAQNGVEYDALRLGIKYLHHVKSQDAEFEAHFPLAEGGQCARYHEATFLRFLTSIGAFPEPDVESFITRDGIRLNIEKTSDPETGELVQVTLRSVEDDLASLVSVEA